MRYNAQAKFRKKIRKHYCPKICCGLRAPQLRIRPRPCPISGVRAKYIYCPKIFEIIRTGSFSELIQFYLNLQKRGFLYLFPIWKKRDTYFGQNGGEF